MRIAVVGGGTAGFIAAAHITKHFSQTFELYHIFDPTLPAIGVGEGTTPAFVTWLRSITGLNEQALQQSCHITRKLGIQFENWGDQAFFHHFYPVRKGYAYHISATKLTELLKDYVSATQIPKRVAHIESDGLAANIKFTDESSLEVDFVIDARGFPKSLSSEHLALNWIPTNAALIRQGPVPNGGKIKVEVGQQKFQYRSATRSIARPHGWIFMIPLTHRASYGYIYNDQISDVAEIKADFDDFLAAEQLQHMGQERQLRFPNFTYRSFFDGAVFQIGNAASFLEPLEATAIACILKQMEVFSHWPLRREILENLERGQQRERLAPENLAIFNQYLFDFTLKNAVFVGWHYAHGSAFNSPFWQFAKDNFWTELQKLKGSNILAEFEQYLQVAQQLPHPFQDHEQFAEHLSTNPKDPKSDRSFGIFPAASFAEVGRGINTF